MRRKNNIWRLKSSKYQIQMSGQSIKMLSNEEKKIQKNVKVECQL